MLSWLFALFFRPSRRQRAFDVGFRGVCSIVASGFCFFVTRTRMLPIAESEKLEGKQGLADSTLRAVNVLFGFSAVFLILGLTLLGIAWWYLRLAKEDAVSREPVLSRF